MDFCCPEFALMNSHPVGVLPRVPVSRVLLFTVSPDGNAEVPEKAAVDTAPIEAMDQASKDTSNDTSNDTRKEDGGAPSPGIEKRKSGDAPGVPPPAADATEDATQDSGAATTAQSVSVDLVCCTMPVVWCYIY